MLAEFRIPRALRPALRQMARVSLPPDAENPALMEPILEHFELSLRCLAKQTRALLLVGLAGLEAGALARHGRRFSRLDRARATAYFDWYWSSKVMALHYLVFAFKAYLSLAYYEQPAVRARIDYHPDAWIAESGKRRLERWAAEIDAHEKDLVAPDALIRAPSLARRAKHA
jgi:hypothetical protein